MKKKMNFYYDTFIDLSQDAVRSSTFLQKVLIDYDQKKLKENLKELHEIEHSADLKRHLMCEKLLKEFITPIEREDILLLSQSLDDIVDAIEEILQKLYMFNIDKIKEETKSFMAIIYTSTEVVKEIMTEFYDFKKSERIKKLIIQVNNLEEQADELYLTTIHNLFVNKNDIVSHFFWKIIFDQLEECCDKCENVANIVEEIILKNS